MTFGRTNRNNRLQIAALSLWAVMAVTAAAQTPEVVGRIEGDNIAVKGQVSLIREEGRRSTTLASGSEVLVRTGSARLTLVDGSEIDICGPAQFSVLRSGGSITVALNSGRVHARLSAQVPVTIYTPLVVATPLSISERPRDAVLGVDGGAVCAHPVHGAIRLEHQLTGSSVIVPQNGEVLLPDGQLESLRDAPQNCRCDAVLADDLEQPRARPQAVSIAAMPAPAPPAPRKEEPRPEPPKPVLDQPAWQVVMPPLTFDASAPAQPEPRPEMALLIRRAQVRTAVVYSGRVVPRNAKKQDVKADGEKKPGFGTRIKNFFRRLFGGKPKESTAQLLTSAGPGLRS